MTVQEKIEEINLQNALRITNDWLSAVQSQELKYKEPCFKCGEMEAIKKALEKQIPKKPNVCKNLMTKESVRVCPSCSTIIENTDSYCYECGQKLDWEEGGTSD